MMKMMRKMWERIWRMVVKRGVWMMFVEEILLVLMEGCWGCCWKRVLLKRE